MPSTQAAKKSARPTARFLYPLAAVCVAAVFLSPSSGQAQTTQKLRPDQERAIEMMLKDVEPSMRPAARAQLATTFGNFNEAQIAMMVAKMNENKAAEAKKLRALLCEIVGRRLFNVVLTPNYNAPHKNHFHLEITAGVKWFLVN